MRSFTLAVVGLAALGQALPTTSQLENRQTLGKPNTVLFPGSAPSRDSGRKHGEKWIFPIPAPMVPSDKREASEIEGLATTFETLASRYADSRPSLSTYLILQHMSSLLAEAGVEVPSDVSFMAPAAVADVSRRQDGVFGIGGGCNVDDLVGLLLTYSSLSSIYGPNPPTAIKTLKEAIFAALKYCNMDPENGGIIPDPVKPGAPMTPAPSSPGAPIKPDPVKQGAPMVPETPRQGGPMVPETPVKGAPMVPETPIKGAPMVPEPAREGAPMVPEPAREGAPMLPEGPREGAPMVPN